MQHDVIVIGGSYAGIAAALQLARARRNVLIVDAGIRRNRFAQTSHGFLGQDGSSPAEIVATARRQLLKYDTVEWLAGEVTLAEPSDEGFIVSLDSGDKRQARRLVLATGVTDILPGIPGLAERWGQSVFHCPYCHGYELDQGRIGVLAVSELSMHHALMLPDWGPTTLLLNESFDLDDGQRTRLSQRGVEIEAVPVDRFEGDHANVVLKDGRTLAFTGVFTAPQTKVSSPIAGQLGCAFDEGPLGTFIRSDMMKATTVPGVFACGDAARAAGSVSLAVGDGAMAGAATHQSLLFGLGSTSQLQAQPRKSA